ncbi:CGI-121-domain-containing protein [Punctularia strigosozonata HHB-11173 SS5]|uniref:EKC/KEOPS complex subunit CGI121 n=1 Tax=Punctularia strigosozonata (strain HHB-11173) TaxID=741275 RepID=R7S2F3_PUNST|nr:CGI-121-domain-containing protein [Punctularia strigosozonata HHB-11173 SS5]EIN04383.1 CGI-121-domain-containing protein [Punctularia strigosozonata HHB-11173 SS5]
MYPQFPARRSTVHVALFVDVRNAAEVRARIVKAAGMVGAEGDEEREAVNFAFVDARLITSVLHLRTAIYQAVLAELQGALRTKTVHSEILWILNPSNNITEAIRRYGVGDDSRALLVVRVAAAELSAPDVEAKMRAVVQGDLVSLDRLQEITDWAAVKKYHKMGADPAVKKAADSAAERAVVDNIATTSVAMKSVAT